MRCIMRTVACIRELLPPASQVQANLKLLVCFFNQNVANQFLWLSEVKGSTPAGTQKVDVTS